MKELHALGDSQLLSAAKNLAATEGRLHARQIQVFAEIARRRLHLKAGFDSLFTYLVRSLAFSKACAYQRSVIAKASYQWPALLTMIEDQRLSLATATLLTKHLCAKNGRELLMEAAGKTRDELEILLAQRTNTPVIRDSVRHVGVKSEVGSPAGAPNAAGLARPGVVGPGGSSGARPAWGQAPTNRPPHVPPHPATPGAAAPKAMNHQRRPQPVAATARAEDVIVKVSFATNKRVSDKLARVKDLLARKYPSGALSDVFETLLDVFLQRYDPQIKAERAGGKQRFGNEPENGEKTGGSDAGKEKATSRYIAAEVKRAVHLRDDGRCTYVSPAGVRCGSRRFLEFDHVKPFGLGGRSDCANNIRLLCSSHNRERARVTFGESPARRRGGEEELRPTKGG